MIEIFWKRVEDLFFIFVPSYKSFLHLTIWCVRGRSTQQVLRSGIATAPPFGRLYENLFAWLTFVSGFKSLLHLTIWCVRDRSTQQALRSGIATAPSFGRLYENLFAWLMFFLVSSRSCIFPSCLYVADLQKEQRSAMFRDLILNETIKNLITILEYLSLSFFCSVRNSYSSYCLFN